MYCWLQQFIKVESYRLKMANGGAFQCKISMLLDVQLACHQLLGLMDGHILVLKRIWDVVNAHGSNLIILLLYQKHLMIDVMTLKVKH